MACSTLDEWLHWIETQHPQPLALGLDRVAAVAEQLSLQLAMPVIAVAGTNGKGSCVALVRSILAAAGYRVGCYTSPHLLRYNERVAVAGELASDQQLCDAFHQVEAARGDIPLTYFEFGTLAALWLFQRAELDVVVLEVGLGGRLDAVNIIDADIAIVSSVDLDHQAWLGEDRDSIGREKAGVFRAGKPAIMGDSRPVKTVTDYADEIGSTLLQRGRDFDITVSDDHCACWGQDRAGRRWQYADLPVPALVVDNVASVLQALALLPLPVEEAAIRQGLAAVSLAARGECIRYRGRTLILDVAHNPAALRAMVARLGADYRRRVAVFSVLADKALAEMIDIAAPALAHWHYAPLPGTARAMPAAEIGAALDKAGAASTSYDSIRQALVGAVCSAEEEDQVLVFGSFYTVAEVMSVLADDNNTSGESGL